MRLRITLVASAVTAVIGLAATSLIVRSDDPDPVAGARPTAPPCTPSFRTIRTLDRFYTDVRLSAAAPEAAFITVLPRTQVYPTPELRGARIDEHGRLTWITFTHPDSQFAFRGAYSPAAVSSTQAWYIANFSGRYVPETLLWSVDGNGATRHAVPLPVRSVFFDHVVARNGHVVAIGATRNDTYMVRRDGATWVEISVDIPEFAGWVHIDIDDDATPYAIVSQKDLSRYTPGSFNDVLYLKQSAWGLTQGKWRELDPGFPVSTIVGGAGGVAWAIGYNPGLTVARLEDGEWTRMPAVDERKAASVVATVDQAGRLWLVDLITSPGNPSESRLFFADGHTLHRRPLPAQAQTTKVFAISAAESSLWLATGQTILRADCA